MLEGGARTIPLTLQQSLAARLDRLGQAREVAQIGAMLGREFSHALLAAVSRLPESTLNASLEKLADADLLFVEEIAPACVYRFKHALIQDAAYESLLKARRQTLHRRAAEALAAAADPQPELVAHHFTQSGLIELAIEWWGKAGDAALRRSAFQEAISHLGKAIEMADKVGGRARNAESASKQRVKLQTDYGRAMMWHRGFAAEETRTAFTRAREMGASVDRPAEHFVTRYGQWLGSLLRAELAASAEIAKTFLREAIAEARTTETAVGFWG
jgi:predicted ATPase